MFASWRSDRAVPLGRETGVSPGLGALFMKISTKARPIRHRVTPPPRRRVPAASQRRPQADLGDMNVTNRGVS
jgi:hypothetical protein